MHNNIRFTIYMVNHIFKGDFDLSEHCLVKQAVLALLAQ